MSLLGGFGGRTAELEGGSAGPRPLLKPALAGSSVQAHRLCSSLDFRKPGCVRRIAKLEDGSAGPRPPRDVRS
jgi:hypothetical protein